MKRQIKIRRCALCNQDVKYISRHLIYAHNITNFKLYYDTYIKKESDGICKFCGCPTKFTQNDLKYMSYCNRKCAVSHSGDIFRRSEEYKIRSNEIYKKISIGLRKFHTTDAGKKCRNKLSISRIGNKNPVHKQDIDTKKRSAYKQSCTMKKKILEGSFTPCITNSWANSKCKLYINNQFYRSTWEAVFQILNPKCIYENIRIDYVSPIDNKSHIYIIDFIDKDNKILYEIKPQSNIFNEVTKAKTEAALKWASNTGYQYKIITNNWFSDNAKKIDYSKYDSKIKKGMRQFLDENKTT